MAKQITQETFDGVVKENVEEFGMTAQEAIDDAVQQFEAQDVNLANIVRDLSLQESSESKHLIVEALEQLKATLETEPVNKDQLKETCAKIESECDIDLAHRCLATKNNAFNLLYNAAQLVQTQPEYLQSVLGALCALCNGQPDILDLRGMNFVLQLLGNMEFNKDCMLSTVKLIHLTCVMHERNRQGYVGKDVIAALIKVLTSYRSNAAIVKQVCVALRTLTLDDDPRVPFGKAHEHAKMIVTEANSLEIILNISKDYCEDRPVLGELFLTLSKLAVRDEFCQEILDLGGLQLMVDALERNMADKAIVIHTLKVMKAIAGNDKVKVEIVRAGGISLILSAMTRHQKQPIVCEIACACIAAIVLRNPEHCRVTMQANGADVLVKTLTLHPDHEGAQKQACMAIRNLVARTRDYCPDFINLGVEPLLQRTLATHKDCQDEAKAALRDLGLKVELIVRWKGEGKGLQR